MEADPVTSPETEKRVLNLYRISQTENNDYDTYDSAVVAAETPDEASRVHPSISNEWDSHCWASAPEQVTVELIGTAKEGTTVGVICASFNAG